MYVIGKFSQYIQKLYNNINKFTHTSLDLMLINRCIDGNIKGLGIETKSNLSCGLRNHCPSRYSLVSYCKKISAFPVYAICFNEIVHGKPCLDNSTGQTANGLEQGLVKHGLTSFCC